MNKHNTIYTALLTALAFFFSMSAVTMFFLSRSSEMSPDSRWVFEMTACIELLYVAAMVATLILRGVAPKAGSVATLALNIILLLFIPIGTALAIYGLWKVDKGDRSTQVSP